MARREDRKSKEHKPKEVSLTLEQKKEKLRAEIQKKFQEVFGHEDRAIIPILRRK